MNPIKQLDDYYSRLADKEIEIERLQNEYDALEKLVIMHIKDLSRNPAYYIFAGLEDDLLEHISSKSVLHPGTGQTMSDWALQCVRSEFLTPAAQFLDINYGRYSYGFHYRLGGYVFHVDVPRFDLVDSINVDDMVCGYSISYFYDGKWNLLWQGFSFEDARLAVQRFLERDAKCQSAQ